MWTVGEDITREEYLHLLDTAKLLDREQAYLLVKVMATTGVSVLGLPRLTVEAVQAGELKVEHDVVPLAPGLRDELTAYAEWKGIQTGPVFATSSGKPYNSTQVSRYLYDLCRSAGLEEEKCRPSALRKLYRATKSEVDARAADMAEQIMNRQADGERLPVFPKFHEKTLPEQKAAEAEVKTEESGVPWSAPDDPGFLMTHEDIEGYMIILRAKGRTAATRQYGSILRQLYNDLPEDKCIRRGTLARWVELLQEKGYAPNTINSFAIVANGFLDYIGHREYQLSDLPKQEKNPQPELTRSEYLQLLQAAKRLDREREYLMVKLFASCDLPVQQLGKVTVEAGRAGSLTVESSGTRSVLHLPGCLCRELLSYAEREGVGTGPIFLSNRDKAMCRASVVKSITRLSEEAGVPSVKGNPACLRRLFRSTRAAVEASFAVLVEQAMDRQAEQEQLIAGWEV